MGNGLYGDGIRDDAPAIQRLLDSGLSCVYLPPPAVHYRIERPLVIHSGQELRLDRFTVIRLAPKADCVMITNDDHDGGNADIAVTGGVWDMDNTAQSPNPLLKHLFSKTPYHPELYLGILMRFVNVQRFTLRSLTLRNPVTFSAQFAKLRHFTMDDITFEQTTWNPSPNNMDGLHFDGGCRFGRLTNLQGTTHDDLVALNADDCEIESPCFGPIEDIEIDGIFTEGCHSGVRLLSAGSPVRRITIRNVFGTFYRYAIGFTQHAPIDGGRGVFGAITLENLQIAKAPGPTATRTQPPPFPLIFFEDKLDVGSLSIKGFYRREEAIPLPALLIQRGVRIDSLRIEDAGSSSTLPEFTDFLVNAGEIGRLCLRDVELSTPGALVINAGSIGEVYQENCRAEESPVRLGKCRRFPGFLAANFLEDDRVETRLLTSPMEAPARKMLTVPGRDEVEGMEFRAEVDREKLYFHFAPVTEALDLILDAEPEVLPWCDGLDFASRISVAPDAAKCVVYSRNLPGLTPDSVELTRNGGELRLSIPRSALPCRRGLLGFNFALKSGAFWNNPNRDGMIDRSKLGLLCLPINKEKE